MNKQGDIYYSTKNWQPDMSFDYINEIIDQISNEDNDIKINNELNQEIWTDDVIIPEIKKILLKNAIEFIKFAKLDKFKFNDIIITGSMANYSWNDKSDIDLHIVMNTNEISSDSELVQEYLDTKKSIWNKNINPKLNNHDIEIYVQDINEPHKSTGVYSLTNETWIKKPIKQMIVIDREIITKKTNDIIRTIDNIIENNNKKEIVPLIKSIFDKLKKYRKIGLNRDGEYSTENLVFKLLRNNGILKDLMDLKNKLIQKSLSV